MAVVAADCVRLMRVNDLLAKVDKESIVNLEHGGRLGQESICEAGQNRQPEYRINLTVVVADPQALWAAAAAKLLAMPDMTLSDVLDVIGPREDPSISDCIATMTTPVAVSGCVMEDFWIDSLRDCASGIASAAVEDKLHSVGKGPICAPYMRRVARPSSRSLMAPLRNEA